MIHDELSSRTDVSRAVQYELRYQCDGICIYGTTRQALSTLER